LSVLYVNFDFELRYLNLFRNLTNRMGVLVYVNGSSMLSFGEGVSS